MGVPPGITMPFIEHESYKHKLAKELLSKWLKESITYKKWEGDGVHLEYALVPAMRSRIEERFETLMAYNNASFISDGVKDTTCYTPMQRFNPSYDDCLKNGDVPLAILDIAVVDHAEVVEGFEIYHSHKVDNNKIKKIIELTQGKYFKLYEVSAEKILCQTKPPENLYDLCDIIIYSKSPDGYTYENPIEAQKRNREMRAARPEKWTTLSLEKYRQRGNQRLKRGSYFSKLIIEKRIEKFVKEVLVKHMKARMVLLEKN